MNLRSAHKSAWRILPALVAVMATIALPQARAQVLTSQYDNARTGANLHETILTPANVNPKQFGAVFTFPVDGAVYAEPLYVPNLEIPGRGTHNVVFVATEHDSVYAFDADGKSRTPLWKVNFTNSASGVTAVPGWDVSCPFIQPEIGITPTPVIDYASGTLYVLARTKEKTGVISSRYVQRLHALAITTGVEKLGGPVEIKASVAGHGEGSSGGKVAFDPLHELPRSSLLLANGKVYLSWASSCDVAPYHGWLMAYDAHTLAQTGVFNTSPDAGQSGIWAGDAGIAADDQGNVYLATGNGKFDAVSGGHDYGDSVLKLTADDHGIELRDYFTPHDEQELNGDDNDLGSGGPVLIPDQPGQHPHLLVVAGKGATLYLLDRDHLGRFEPDTDRNAVQTLPVALGGGSFGAPAYWNHHLYFVGSDDVLKDFALDHGQLKPAARGTVQFIDPGATPTLSANGTRNGIVWALSSKRWNEPDGPPEVLRAFDAADVSRQLYSSEQIPARDRGGVGLRFNIPLVVNGRVYVGTKGGLDVYGLLTSH
ncbi:MAG TPA: pyrrolo-quinoline quinone [Terriglobia bacterium]|nr:pyrrolo-quinoline quinone [Terriglobia bacterium]